MKLRVITVQLSKKLPLENKLQKLTNISHDSFESIYKLIHSKKITELHVTDATCSNKIPKGKTVQVKDHINKTGSSILIGRQALLNVDFINMLEVRLKRIFKEQR